MSRRGFAAPLAVMVLLVLALLAALAVEATLGEVRATDALRVEIRAGVVAESALAAALARRVDTAAKHAPVGMRLFATSARGRDTVRVDAIALQANTVWLGVRVGVGSGRLRAATRRVAFAEILPVTPPDSEARLRLLSANAWVAVP